jgi:Dolichyl-phosphate-mannose-protein mannosyltransferase
VAAVVRLPSLRALPIFGDEAMFLRLARILRDAPLDQLWIPLRLPLAPLHVWLLAVGLPISTDPVVAGRLLSVVFGTVSVVVLAVAVLAIGRAFGKRTEDALVAGTFAAVSPFLVFSDRLARPDTLFTLETILAAAVSISFVTRVRSLVPAVAFGVLMGVTMLTRQAVSYPLWLLPPVAAACVGRRDWRRVLAPLGLSLAIALALWVPMLVAPGWPDLGTRIFHVALSRPPLSIVERVGLFVRNLAIAVVTLWTYLTPPVFLASLVGLFFLAVARRRLFSFLAAWLFLVFVPVALFAGDYFPRYALPAVPPLLAAVGFVIAFAWRRLPGWRRIALVTALLAWPAIAVARGIRDWREWPYLPVDRSQFVTGWPAGEAPERAAAFLSSVARSGPIDVVVPVVSGNPSDAVWLLLDRAPNVRLLYAEDFLTQPATRVRGDVWIDRPSATVRTGVPVYFVAPDPAFTGRGGWVPVERVLPPLNPGARTISRFDNPPKKSGEVESGVVLYRLR